MSAKNTRNGACGDVSTSRRGFLRGSALAGAAGLAATLGGFPAYAGNVTGKTLQV